MAGLGDITPHAKPAGANPIARPRGAWRPDRLCSVGERVYFTSIMRRVAVKEPAFMRHR